MFEAPQTRDAKAFWSWQSRHRREANVKAVERALGQMRHHWSKMTIEEKQSAHNALLLPDEFRP